MFQFLGLSPVGGEWVMWYIILSPCKQSLWPGQGGVTDVVRVSLVRVSLGDSSIRQSLTHMSALSRLSLTPLRPFSSSVLCFALSTVSPAPALGEPAHSSGLPQFAFWGGLEQSRI